MDNYLENRRIISNAAHIEEVSKPVMKLALLRFQAIADYLTEQPVFINVKENREDCNETFEQILRMRKWVIDEYTVGFSIFSSDREISKKNTKFILKSTIWNRAEDLKAVQNLVGDVKEKYFNGWPNVLTQYIYIGCNIFKELLDSIAEIDKIVTDKQELLPLNLEDKKRQENLRQIEIKRLYPRGIMRQISWSGDVINVKLEEALDLFCKMFDANLEKYNLNEMAYQLEADYDYPLELYKKNVFGINDN